MLLWEILVPTTRPGGRPFRTRFHRVWDERVLAVAGGLTILRPVLGQWLCPAGNLCRERMIPVRVACDRTQMERIADFTAHYHGQRAVMYWLVSAEAVIKHYGGEPA